MCQHDFSFSGSVARGKLNIYTIADTGPIPILENPRQKIAGKLLQSGFAYLNSFALCPPPPPPPSLYVFLFSLLHFCFPSSIPCSLVQWQGAGGGGGEKGEGGGVTTNSGGRHGGVSNTPHTAISPPKPLIPLPRYTDHEHHRPLGQLRLTSVPPERAWFHTG